MNDALPVPNDLAACQKLIVAQSVQIAEQDQKLRQQDYTLAAQAQAVVELQETLAKLQQENAEQQLTINELLQQAYRHRSERYREDPHQLKLDFGNTPEAADAAEGLAQAMEEAELTIAAHQRRVHKPRKSRNESLPAHLPREEVTLEAGEEVRHCPLHGPRKPIGYDRQETLVFERPKLKVRVTLIPKYACEGHAECGVKEALRPEGLVEGNRYDTSVAAEIITNKSGYHLPIYRQQDQFAGSGWTPSRSTLLNILVAAAACLRPLVESLREVVLASGRLGTDDTRTTLLLPAEIPKAVEGDAKSQRIYEVFSAARAEGKPSVSGRMWAYRSLTVPIGRKNWLFVGSVAAGERAADFFTVVSSAVRNHLDVWAYVKEVLDRLLAGDRDYAAMRPDHWAAAHPEHIREYRVEERRDRADAKQVRRATRRRASAAR